MLPRHLTGVSVPLYLLRNPFFVHVFLCRAHRGHGPGCFSMCLAGELAGGSLLTGMLGPGMRRHLTTTGTLSVHKGSKSEKIANGRLLIAFAESPWGNAPTGGQEDQTACSLALGPT